MVSPPHCGGCRGRQQIDSVSAGPREAARPETFDNAAFMGAQHKGDTVSCQALPWSLSASLGRQARGRHGAGLASSLGTAEALCMVGESFQVSGRAGCRGPVSSPVFPTVLTVEVL